MDVEVEVHLVEEVVEVEVVAHQKIEAAVKEEVHHEDEVLHVVVVEVDLKEVNLL